jgi:hypothetical protein
MFSFRKDKKTWTEAQAECKKWGGNLASIHNQAQQDYLFGKTANEAWWVGMNTDKWADGTKTAFVNHANPR